MTITDAFGRKDTVRPTLSPVKDGKQEISYVPKTKGPHRIDIAVGGTPIQGSPFDVEVQPSSTEDGWSLLLIVIYFQLCFWLIIVC